MASPWRALNLGIVFICTSFIFACSNESGSGGDITNFDKGTVERCGGKIEMELSGIDSTTMLPLDLTAATASPWGVDDQGGYTIRTGENHRNFSVKTSGEISAHCALLYDFFDPITPHHTTENKFYNHAIFFRITPQRYHEANPEVFNDMAALQEKDMVDETKNVALNQAYDAGLLDNQLMFAGIDPSDTNENVLGGWVVPTPENKNIIGSFDRIELNCGENFKVKPVLLPENISSGYEINPNFCGMRKPLDDPQSEQSVSYCVDMMVEPPPEGSICTFSAEVRANDNAPDTLIPPTISGVSIAARIEGSLERLVSITNNSDDAQFHRWKLRINAIHVIAQP